MEVLAKIAQMCVCVHKHESCKLKRLLEGNLPPRTRPFSVADSIKWKLGVSEMSTFHRDNARFPALSAVSFLMQTAGCEVGSKRPKLHKARCCRH